MNIKKKWAVPTLLLLVLIITNPSRKRFNQFSGQEDNYSEYRRTKN